MMNEVPDRLHISGSRILLLCKHLGSLNVTKFTETQDMHNTEACYFWILLFKLKRFLKVFIFFLFCFIRLDLLFNYCQLFMHCIYHINTFFFSYVWPTHWRLKKSTYICKWPCLNMAHVYWATSLYALIFIYISLMVRVEVIYWVVLLGHNLCAMFS